MKEPIDRIRICPRCGKPYSGYPATSRVDSAPICTDCGIRESLASIGVDEEEQDAILEVMHRRRR